MQNYTTDKSDRLTKVTEWQTVTQFNAGHRSEQKNFSSHVRFHNFEQLSCGAKMTHRDFQLALIWNSIEKAMCLPYFSVLGKTSAMYKQIPWLKVNSANTGEFNSR